jgi:RNA polymerase sigma-70 factor (ECF subfamily)
MSRSASEEAVAVPPLAGWPMTHHPKSSERAILRAAQDGEPEAIDSLVRHHWPDLYRVALLVTHDPAGAEDIAQESMLAALDNLHRFDRRHRLRPWLHRIATNRAIDWARGNRRRDELARRALEASASPDSEERGLSAELQGALEQLDAEDRAIVVLRHLFEYRSHEIGRMLGVPAGTVRRRLGGSLERLRSELGQGRKQ